MRKLHIVASSIGSDAQMNSSTARIVGAYTDSAVAECVRQVAWGDHATVTTVEVDQIEPELLREMDVLGIKLPPGNPLPMGTELFTVVQGPADIERLRRQRAVQPL